MIVALLALIFALPLSAQTLEIKTDPRVDLVGLVQQLAGDNSFKRERPLKDILARFKPWRGHPVVKRLARLSKRGFGGNLPSNYAVYLTTSTPLREEYPAPAFFSDACGGRAELDAFRAELDDFARQSGFFAWEASSASLSGALADALKRDMGRTDFEGPLVDYLGLRTWRRWTVVPSPFYPPGGSSSWVLEEKPGRPDVFVVIGPTWSRGEPPRGWEPSFGKAADIATYIWAEPIFSTAYFMYEACHPLARAPADVCSASPGLGNAEDCVERQWVNAVIGRVLHLAFGPEAEGVPGYLPAPKAREALDRFLTRYEGARERYPDLVSATSELFAPFQADKAPPDCRIVDRGRLKEEVYSRRLRYYVLSKLERHRDPELERLRDELEK